MAWLRSEAAILTDTRRRRFGRRRLELYFVDLKPQIVDRFMDVIAIPVADAFKLRRRHVDNQRSPFHVRKPRRFQPGLKTLPLDLLFQRTEDAHPLV